jgi:hypothetical protein
MINLLHDAMSNTEESLGQNIGLKVRSYLVLETPLLSPLTPC